jgi:hypothetical protein
MLEVGKSTKSVAEVVMIYGAAALVACFETPAANACSTSAFRILPLGPLP